MNQSDGMQQVHFDETPAAEAQGTPEQPREKRTTMNAGNFSIKSPVILVAAVILIVAGVGSGYALTKVVPGGTSKQAGTSEENTAKSPEEGVEVGSVYGSPDKDTFKDEAEGVLVAGGVEGEGSHHLLRPGGPSQNVYLTSSVVDLDLFENHKVKVWGETFAAQKAGWLMDVGRVEVMEMNAEMPFEE